MLLLTYNIIKSLKPYLISNYYKKYITKEDYDRVFTTARTWALGEGADELLSISARIYSIKEEALSKSI